MEFPTSGPACVPDHAKVSYTEINILNLSGTEAQTYHCMMDLNSKGCTAKYAICLAETIVAPVKRTGTLELLRACVNLADQFHNVVCHSLRLNGLGCYVISKRYC